MAERSNLGLLLKRYRIAAGLSQEALAQRADVSARAISDLERGLHRAPHAATLDLLATALALTAQQRALFLAAARPELVANLRETAHSSSLPYDVLPTPLAPLIGREREQALALAPLRERSARLVTITGPSGVGKTRLALQVAHEAAPGYADGAIFVNLASLHDASLVLGAIATALHVRDQGDVPLPERLRASLREKALLLLLDNFEQVIDAAVDIADLLTWCPRVTMIVTSRTPLRVRGEHIIPLMPLALEDAIILFRTRAHAIRPDIVFAVADIAAICERLDCLPLALELAASQVVVFSLPKLLDELSRHMRLIFEVARDLPERQRTMEAAIGWSYELLDEGQRRCFRALGVFVDGFSLSAARAVCWDEDASTEADALLTLATLVDASLVQVETAQDGSPRFYQLELIREFALRRLRITGETDACQRRHAAYYASLARSLMSVGFGPDSRADLLARNLTNARAALEWAQERREAVLGLQLAGFTRLWNICGMNGEAERWLATMLALDAEARSAGESTAPQSLRVERLYGLARVRLNAGKLELAEVAAQESLALARQIGDENGLCDAYATLGMIAQARGDIEQATAAFTQSVAHAGSEAWGERRYRALYYLAEIARQVGDLDRARSLLDDALAGARAAENDWDCAVMTTMLAHLERQQQIYDVARAHYLDGLDRFQRYGSPTFFAWCLEGFSALLVEEGRFARAARLCSVAATLRTRARTPLPATERALFGETLSRARAALGPARFDAEWSTGSTLSEAAALAEANAAES
jgi:predicted ATPase/DNA-binding XRE family transcriptional regulator